MAKKKNIKADDSRLVEARELIGKGIISGLLKPGGPGFDILQAYNQGDGGYWQNDGTSHTQGSGDYHQGTA